MLPGPLLPWLILAACRPTDGDPPRPAHPKVLAADLQGFPETPFSRLVTLESDVPTRVEVELEGPDEAWRVTWPGFATRHEIPVHGLKADRDWVIRVRVFDEAGLGTRAVPFDVHPDPLPASSPHFDVLAHDPDRAEPGYILANIELVSGTGWLAMLDARDLQVAWLYNYGFNFGDVGRTPEGTLLGLTPKPTEVDMLGRPLRRWTDTPTEPFDQLLEVPTNHELFPLGDGTFLTLTESTVDVALYPTDYVDPTTNLAPATIRDARVIRFHEDSTVLSDWSMAERLDPSHIGFGSLDLFADGYDWIHANAVIPTEDGGFIVSGRHINALARFDSDGDLVWLLGDPAGWGPELAPTLLQPVGDLDWPYHQHAPALDDDGTLWMFDNGNDGYTPYGTPPAEAQRSRVVAFRIDEQASTVEQVFELAELGGSELFSPALGDADPLPQTGHVLADFGFVTFVDGVANLDLGRGNRSVRLVEIDRDAPDDLVIDVSLWTDVLREPLGVKTYRAEHVPSLYPDGVAVEPLDQGRWSSP